MFFDGSACGAEWLVRETQNLLIAAGRRSNPRPSRIFANSMLILIFLVALSTDAFCFLAFCFLCICDAELRFFVLNWVSFIKKLLIIINFKEL